MNARIEASDTLQRAGEKLDATDCTMRAAVVALNRLARLQDDSRLWPILGQFNATERAIRRLRAMYRDNGGPSGALEYALALDYELSAIVNGES